MRAVRIAASGVRAKKNANTVLLANGSNRSTKSAITRSFTASQNTIDKQEYKTAWRRPTRIWSAVSAVNSG